MDIVGKQLFFDDVQLAARWGMSAKTLRNLRVSGGGITFVRIGRLVRYKISDIEAHEEANRCASTFKKRGEA